MIDGAFVKWQCSAARRFTVPIQITKRVGEHVQLSFGVTTPPIIALLNGHELRVLAHCRSEDWDPLLSLKVRPKPVPAGYICEDCMAAPRTTFPSLDALWRDHLFEPFLSWINDELVHAGGIGVYYFPTKGVICARLLPKDRPPAIEPDLCVPLRISPA